MSKKLRIDIKTVLFILFTVVILALGILSDGGKDGSSQSDEDELTYEYGYSEGFDDGMAAFEEEHASLLNYAAYSSLNDDINYAIYEIQDYINGEGDYSLEEINELCDMLKRDRQDFLDALK